MTQRPLQPKRRLALPTIVATALIAAGAVAGATVIFSNRTQDLAQDFTQKLEGTLNATGYASAQQTSYQKGLTSSTQTMTIKLLEGKSEKPLRLLVTNHIKHGPFPGFSGVGQAMIDTDIRFEDPKIQAEVDKAFAGQKPTVHTLVGLSGNTDTKIEVPGGAVTESQVNVSWKPLLAYIKVSGQQSGTNLNWPGLTYTATEQGHKSTGEITGVQLVGNQQRDSAADKVGTGKSVFTIAKMQITDKGGLVLLNNIKVASEAKTNGQNFYDALAEYNVGELGFAGKSLKNLQFHLGLRHLAREPLSRLLTLLGDLQSQVRQAGESGRVPDLTDARTRQAQQDFAALMKGAPQLTLDRLSVTQPSGDIVVSGKLSAPQLAQPNAEQLSAGDWKMLASSPQMLLSMLEVHLNGSANKQALGELTALLGGQGAGLSQNVQGLIDSGYVNQTGEQLTVKFDFKDGAPLLNGKPLGQ